MTKNKYARVFVIGFAPSVGRDGSEMGATTGGFNWVRTWDDVRKFMNKTEADWHDFRVATIEVPAKLNNEGITSWLDERRNLWEPPTPEYDDEEEVAEAMHL